MKKRMIILAMTVSTVVFLCGCAVQRELPTEPTNPQSEGKDIEVPYVSDIQDDSIASGTIADTTIDAAAAESILTEVVTEGLDKLNVNIYYEHEYFVFYDVEIEIENDEVTITGKVENLTDLSYDAINTTWLLFDDEDFQIDSCIIQIESLLPYGKAKIPRKLVYESGATRCVLYSLVYSDKNGFRWDILEGIND